jgi:nucleoside-diphosphate-sugar epimerase
MKVLFIGGTGVISSACSQLAIAQGIDLYLLNRGLTTRRPAPIDACLLRADLRDPVSMRRALADHHFDVVVNWFAFTPEQIELDIELFTGRTRQYIFISSASVYETPPTSLPVTESTPVNNPYWDYSQAKIACEKRLRKAHEEDEFPVTIVRPAHTYDQTLLPFDEGYTVVDRMRRGKAVIVHGDGASLWTMTHHQDFAKGFLGLLLNPQAIGEAVHITTDEWLTWNQIYDLVGHAAGVKPQLVHIPSDLLIAHYPDLDDASLQQLHPMDRLLRRPNLLGTLKGDRTHSMIYDNSKIKRLAPGFAATIPFAQGAFEMMAWHDADPRRKVVDPQIDRLMDNILDAYALAWPAKPGWAA